YVRRYPVGHPFAPYLPLALAVHLPIATLPYGAAEVMHFTSTALLTLALASIALAAAGARATVAGVFAIAAALLLSRPGHWNQLLGQPTMELVVASGIALLWAGTRPLLAALGLAISTFKPTFGLPLAVLMLVRGDTRTVVLGGALSAAVSLAVVVVLVGLAGSFRQLGAEIETGFAAWQSSPDPSYNPVAYYGAIDASALVSR